MRTPLVGGYAGGAESAVPVCYVGGGSVALYPLWGVPALLLPSEGVVANFAVSMIVFNFVGSVRSPATLAWDSPPLFCRGRVQVQVQARAQLTNVNHSFESKQSPPPITRSSLPPPRAHALRRRGE